MTSHTFLRSRVDAAAEPYELPADDILDGDPNPGGASITWTTDAGSTVTAGIFTLQPGVIRANVSAAETIHVLEGEISVELESGETLELSAGDVVLFPPGTTTTRTVKSPYKEFYVQSTVR